MRMHYVLDTYSVTVVLVVTKGHRKRVKGIGRTEANSLFLHSFISTIMIILVVGYQLEPKY
jgi:hypothetical protein